MPPRKAGAPRLIEWTGERLVPWAPDAQVVYEHFHRYLWAQPLVAGRRVLDLGSGEGFGSALLADTAVSVIGVDVDERAVEHSRLGYAAPNLEFRVASASDLAGIGDDSVDAVIAFEIIEHVADHEAVMAEVERVLSPGGLLVMSTPERRAYSDARDFSNPFHERELTLDELEAMLGARFAHVALFSQRAVSGSRIEALDPAPAGGHLQLRIERRGDEWVPGGVPSPLYVIAVASSAPLPELPAGSDLADYELTLVGELRDELAAVQSEYRSEKARLTAELLERTDQLTRQLEAAHARAQRAEDEAARVTDSATWRLLERVRAVVGPDTLAGRALRRAAGLAYRLTGSRRSAAPRD